jgi:hypothetical protein
VTAVYAVTAGPHALQANLRNDDSDQYGSRHDRRAGVRLSPIVAVARDRERRKRRSRRRPSTTSTSRILESRISRRRPRATSKGPFTTRRPSAAPGSRRVRSDGTTACATSSCSSAMRASCARPPT